MVSSVVAPSEIEPVLDPSLSNILIISGFSPFVWPGAKVSVVIAPKVFTSVFPAISCTFTIIWSWAYVLFSSKLNVLPDPLVQFTPPSVEYSQVEVFSKSLTVISVLFVIKSLLLIPVSSVKPKLISSFILSVVTEGILFNVIFPAISVTSTLISPFKYVLFSSKLNVLPEPSVQVNPASVVYLQDEVLSTPDTLTCKSFVIKSLEFRPESLFKSKLISFPLVSTITLTELVLIFPAKSFVLTSIL